MARTRHHLPDAALTYREIPGAGAGRRVMGDEDELRAVVSNLLDNAIKYSQAGEVRVDVELDQADESGVQLRVRDYGIGIPEVDQKRIFKRFYRIPGVATRVKGTGLGLFIVRSAVKRHKGATMALLRDDKVTVRRAGLTTARYREVMITPIGEGLNDEQVTWLDRALVQAGATQVPRLPRLVTRLGAPATGPTDVPEPIPFEAAAPFKRFVSQLMARRLREIVKADLAIRGGDLNAVSTLADQADRLGRAQGVVFAAGSGVGRGRLRRTGLDHRRQRRQRDRRPRPAVEPGCAASAISPCWSGW